MDSPKLSQENISEHELGSLLETGKRVLRSAILPAAFNTDLFYQENIFAAELHAMGHSVKVFSTYHGAGGSREEVDRKDRLQPFPIVRTSRIARWRKTQVPLDRAFVKELRDFEPDVAFLLAPNHGFSLFLGRSLPAQTRIVAVFSDLPWHRGRLSSWVKSKWTKYVVSKAWKVLAVTMETGELIKSWSSSRDHHKIQQTGLAFCPRDFSGGELPAEARALAGKVSRLICCVTRFSTAKRLDDVFEAVEKFLILDPDAGFIYAGIGVDQESCRFTQRVVNSKVSKRCVVLPLLTGPEIGAVFRASVCSIWSLVSIGIYHSLNCGCPVLVKEGQDARHLLENSACGIFFESEAHLDACIFEVVQRTVDRNAISGSVKGYHALRVLSDLLSDLPVTGARS